MEYLLKPLTKRMIEQLILVRNIELSESENNIALTHHFKNSLTGLFRRGFIETKMVRYGGKELMNVYLTESGVSFLTHYHEKNADWKD